MPLTLPTESTNSEKSETPIKRTKQKKVPLKFGQIKKRFSHLFPIRAGDSIEFDTTKPIKDWLKTDSRERVHPEALSLLVGRIFALKYNMPVHTSRITAQLNGSGKKAVQLRSLSRIVSHTIDELIKGPTDKKEYLPEVPPPNREKLPWTVLKFSGPPTKDTPTLRKNSEEHIISLALGYVSQLK